jgi:N-formylmaleamate deformylase
MTHYSKHFVTVNGIQVNYYRSTPEGGAPALVMIHGLTDSGLCWGRVADALDGAYDIILPDTRGHGFSDKPADGYTSEALAADVAGLIDALGLDRPVLIGHSLGGQIATFTAAEYPQKVRAVVLEDPAWLDGGDAEGREASAAQWCGDLREHQGMEREGLIALCNENNPAWHADEVGPWADSRKHMDERALRQILLSLQPGWRDALRKIQCPVLLVTGDPACGVIISPEGVKEAVGINPRVREAHVARAGHSIHREQFADYMQQVKGFLDEVR